MHRVIATAAIIGSIAVGLAQAQIVGVPGAGGAVDVQTGQFFPSAGPGLVVNPQNGQVAPYLGVPQQTQTLQPQPQPQYHGGVAIDPRSGQVYTDVGDGYVDPQTGQFVPKSEEN